MTSPQEEKRQAFATAIGFLQEGGDAGLRYAALDLRRCIEAVVYEKVWAYRNRLPEGIADHWQPPKAFAALLEFDPHVDKTSRIGVAPQAEEGVPSEGPFSLVGVDVRPEKGWLKKEWNKLGNLLHALYPFEEGGLSRKPPAEVRKYLAKVAQALLPFVENSFTATLGWWSELDCVACGSPIRVNAAGLSEKRSVHCWNPNCDLEYEVSPRADGRPVWEVSGPGCACSKCGERIPVAERLLAEDYRFTCLSCKTAHVLKLHVEVESSVNTESADKPSGDAPTPSR